MQTDENAAMVRLAVKRHREAAATLFATVQGLGRPWAEESLAERSLTATVAFGEAILREVREGRQRGA